MLPWAGDAITSFAGTFVLLTTMEPSPGDVDRSPSVGRLVRVAHRTLSKRAVGAFVVYTGLLFGLLNTVEILVQPVSVDVVGIAPAHLGFVYAGFTVLSAALASQSGPIREVVGPKAWFGLVPPALGALFAAVVAAPWVALVAFFAMRGVSAVSHPLASQYLNDRTASEGRATVLSAASMIRSVFTAPLNVVGGVLVGALVLPLALGVLGVALLLGSLVVLVYRFPVVDSGDVDVVDLTA